MEYKILTADNMSVLEAEVNAAIAHGWLPCGGIAINEYMKSWENDLQGYSGSENHTLYAQAITKST